MSSMEKERKGDKEALSEQMRQVVSSEKDLLKETKNLKDALSKPEIRGMWGEMQLKRVIEVSGMVNNCDFLEQSVGDTEGRMRPDMVIKLAGDRCIIVDAKAPFEGFLKALSTDCEKEKLKQMERHARHLRTHIQMLSKKKYYEGFTNTPEFVVLFLPSEVFFSAAMQIDPSLMEYGASLGVILSTPTTLIGLLRSVAYGWKSETVAQHAKAIQSLGQELYKRLLDMSKHLSSIGRSLNSAVEGYNKTVGTYERRVLSSARKFQDLGATSGGAEIALLEQIEAQTRNVKSLHLDNDEVTVE
jgi:DNA recombination protein RmuC